MAGLSRAVALDGLQTVWRGFGDDFSSIQGGGAPITASTGRMPREFSQRMPFQEA
jgi:hypothetical protein